MVCIQCDLAVHGLHGLGVHVWCGLGVCEWHCHGWYNFVVAVPQAWLLCGPECTGGLLTVPRGGYTPLKGCVLVTIQSWAHVKWVQQHGGGGKVIHGVMPWVTLVVFDSLLHPQYPLGTFWCITAPVGTHTTV